MNNICRKPDEIFSELFQRYPQSICCQSSIWDAYILLCECFIKKGCLYVAGNGGSASDSEHIVGELMKSFNIKRKISDELQQQLIEQGELGRTLSNELEGALAAVSLPALTSLSTAIINDTVSENIYAQMVLALGNKDDIFMGISTSGNSANIVRAALVAKSKGMKVIGLAGNNMANLDNYSDIIIHVPETETYKIQELHLPIYHAICAMLEARFFI